MARIRPHLFDTHPGYATVVSSIGLTHLGLLTDSLFRTRHTGPAFRVALEILPLRAWSFIHLFILALVVAGLYTKFNLVRFGMLLSVTSFTLLGSAFLVSSIQSHISFVGPVLCLSAALTALAAVTEPEVQPARKEHHEGK